MTKWIVALVLCLATVSQAEWIDYTKMLATRGLVPFGVEGPVATQETQAWTACLALGKDVGNVTIWGVGCLEFLDVGGTLYEIGAAVTVDLPDVVDIDLPAYFGGQCLYVNSDLSRSEHGMLIGPIAGIRRALSEDIAIVAETQYRFIAGSTSPRDSWQVLVGLEVATH